MRTLLILSLALGACTPTYDLTPNIATGTTGYATFYRNTEARIVVDDNRMRTTVEGVLDVVVTTGGAINTDPVLLTTTHRDLRMGREAMGESVVLTATSDLPDTLVAAFAHEGLTHALSLLPDHTVAVSEGEPVPGTDADVLFDALRWAPEGKVPLNTKWSHELGEPDEDGNQWYRTYKFASVEDGVALIKFMHLMGDPITGDPGPEERQVRGEQEIDLATGLPYNFRQRDLTRRMVGEDTRATFHWPGLAVIEP